MRPKKENCFFIFVIFISLFVCTMIGCDDTNDSLVESIRVNDQILQPGKLIKIDDYPLFVMSYNEDYGFKDYLKTGYHNSLMIPSNQIEQSEKWGCTCFSVFGNPENMLMGRNFDFYHHIAMVLYTKPTNAYASLSTVDLYYLGFDQNATVLQIQNSPSTKNAPYYPFDGVNEKGVSIGMMAIPSAQPPKDPAKINLGCLQLIRLVLDYAASTDEAVLLLKNYNYTVEDPPIHFLIADKNGKSVIIEYVNSDIKVIANNEPFQVCTNFVITGSNAPTSTSCWRYNTAYKELKNNSGKINDVTSMNLLKSVSQSITMWSAVFNLSKKSLSICMGRNFENTYSVSMP